MKSSLKNNQRTNAHRCSDTLLPLLGCIKTSSLLTIVLLLASSLLFFINNIIMKWAHSYDSTFCMGHYPHLRVDDGALKPPTGLPQAKACAQTQNGIHTAHELFFGKRCEQEKVGVIEAWGTQAQNEPGATYKIRSIYATSVGVAGIIDDGLNSVLTWGNHYGDVPTYLRGIKTMYTNFENYAAVTHNGVLYNWGRDARTLNFNLTDVDEVFTNPKSFCVKFKNNTLFVFGDLNRGGCNRCESGNGIACSGSNPSQICLTQ